MYVLQMLSLKDVLVLHCGYSAPPFLISYKGNGIGDSECLPGKGTGAYYVCDTFDL